VPHSSTVDLFPSKFFQFSSGSASQAHLMVNCEMNSITHLEDDDATDKTSGTAFILQLSADVVVGNVLPFIMQKKTLATLATVSRHFRDILFSKDAEHIWNHDNSTFHLCIDTFCANCMMKKKQRKGSHFGSVGFLRKFPIGNLTLHCFVTDIPDCIEALSERKYLKTLELTLSNKSNSPPLEDLLEASPMLLNSRTCEKNCMFTDLKDLKLDSSHLQHVNLPGRARLLDILGANLESLTFSGLSPAGINS
jgi:hypothetical protein